MKNEMYEITSEDLLLINEANEAVIEMLEELKGYKENNGENERYLRSFERIKKISLAFNSAYSAIGKSIVERQRKLEEIREKFIILEKYNQLKNEHETASRI